MKIYQIYFDDNQIPGLDYIPYLNDACTVYFENSVIRLLVDARAHHDTDYFGVVSHQLRSKLLYTKDAWAAGGAIANISTQAFTVDAFNDAVSTRLPDAMSFQTHVPHDPITLADLFHPHLSRHFQNIMKAIGYDWTPTTFEHVFYFNYFVAKPTIYERYVTEMLAPAMDVMAHMPELMTNSNYPYPLPEPLRMRFGIPFYPYHPFLCERFFSYFAHLHRLDCAHF
jgi:hypothetical protein